MNATVKISEHAQCDNNIVIDYGLVARQALTLIRNLSDYQRGSAPDDIQMRQNLAVIGELSDALHNLPDMNKYDDFRHHLTLSKLIAFIRRYPNYAVYFERCICPC